VVGDDVYKEDPTINELERRVADLLGKEDALFVPSGTMGNLSAVMAHSWTRGQEVLIGDQSHMFVYEQGGISQLGGVFVSAVPTLEDGTFDLDILESKIRPSEPEIHETTTALICLENTHNRCGGKVLKIGYIQKVCDLALRHGIPVHMDGARIINASVALGVPPGEIVKDCASVSMCLSKAIGAPVGSVVAGSKEFISKVHRCRKVLGGAMRQAGVLAAAGLVALDTAEKRLKIDHQRTKKLAQDIYNLKSPLITVNPKEIESNMVLLCFPSDCLTSEQFVERMAQVKDDDKEKVQVKASTWFRNRVRCVLHSDISEKDLESALKKIKNLYS